MPTYPTYKLGEIVDFYSGYGFPKNLQGKKIGKYPFYKVGDISKNVQNGFSHLLLCDNFIDDNDLSALKGVLLPESTLVFAKIGEALKLNRRALTKGLCLVDNNVVGIKAKTDKCLDLYLFYYFKTIKLEKYSRATTVPSVRKSDIELIPIPLPPLPTQRAIVTRIEALFAELDKAVQHLRTAQQQLKTYRQAVLNHWLNNDDGKWEVVKLGEVIEKPTYGTSKKCDYDIVGTGVLRIPNIGNGYIIDEDLKFAVFSDEEKEKYSLKEGDLLTIRSNGSVDLVGKCALISSKEEKYLFAGYLIRLRPFPEKVNSKYLTLTLESHKLRIQIEDKAKSTSGVNNINSVEIQKLIIPLPPLAEQQRIVQEIESRLSQATASETYIENALQQAEALRQSILKKAFSGELV